MRKFILDDDGNPIETENSLVWAHWFEEADNKRRLARTVISRTVDVSTVFLGFDHGFDGGVPILWETLVFGGGMNEHMERYTTKESALAGHERICKKVREYAETHCDHGNKNGLGCQDCQIEKLLEALDYYTNPTIYVGKPETDHGLVAENAIKEHQKTVKS